MVKSKSVQPIQLNPSNNKELKEAFHVFNGVAEQLTATYDVLEHRINSLHQELSETERERLQQYEENARLASRHSLLLASLPAGVVVINPHGQIQESNPAAEDLLGLPLEGELWRDIIARAFLPDTQSGQEAITTKGRVVSISTSPLGKEPGQIIMLTDVTDTRVLQSSLERYKRLSALGEMSAKLAHQIRTPLASALLYTSNLSKQHLHAEERTRFTAKVFSRLKHLEKIVEDMLAFTRDGSANHQQETLADLFMELDQALEVHLESTECSLLINHAEPAWQVSANKDALVSVLQNLVINATQACGVGGKIKISTQQAPGQIASFVDIFIQDTGPGIRKEIQAQIFEPFFTTHSRGTGLGLAVALAVVQSHEGKLWVDSSDQNGTTFVIRLPLISAANDTENAMKNARGEK